MLYYRKGAAAQKAWLTSSSLKAYLHRASDKVGLFIFACYSYQYRKATQLENYRLKTTGLKSGMYSYAPPPFFDEVWEATTL